MGNLVANCLGHWSVEGAAGCDALAKLVVELIDGTGDGGIDRAIACQWIFERDIFFARSAADQFRADTLVVRINEGVFLICLIGCACGWWGRLRYSRTHHMDDNKGNNEAT